MNVAFHLQSAKHRYTDTYTTITAQLHNSYTVLNTVTEKHKVLALKILKIAALFSVNMKTTDSA